jgi:acetylornithine deacetylase/succinyl-diaminopimelate desuccinylase family protein
MFQIDQKEIVKLTCDLISKNTVNPPGNEYLAKGIALKAMKSLGMTVQAKEKEKGRTNLIGRIGRGKPSVALIAHLDVVPAGDGWKTDPFKPVVKNGRIYGRGALDDKGLFAASYGAIKAFLKNNSKFKGTIYFLAAADEEQGSRLGIEWLIKQGFKADFAIIPDSGLMDEAIIGEKGVLWIEITSFGKQAHGSTPELGINALEKLSKLILRLPKINFGRNFNRAFQGTTVNIGQIQGGEAPNIVPAKAKAKIDIRYPLGIKRKDVLEKIKNEIDRLRKEDSEARFKIEVKESKRPHLVPKDSLLCRKFLEAAKELRLPMKLKTVGGITVGKDLFFSGIPSICHYPTRKQLAHMANEYVEIKLLLKSAELYALTLEKLLKTSK